MVAVPVDLVSSQETTTESDTGVELTSESELEDDEIFEPLTLLEHFSLVDPDRLDEAAAAGELAVLVPLPEQIHPAVAANARVETSVIRGLLAQVSSARRNQLAAMEKIDGAEAQAASFQVELDLVTVALRESRAKERTAIAVAERASEDMASYAIDAFVMGAEPDVEDFRIGGEVDRFSTINSEAGDIMHAQLVAAIEARDAAIETTKQHASDKSRLVVAVEEAKEAAVSAALELEDATGELERLVPRIEPELMTAPVVGVDFPLVVLDAYYRGAEWADETYPRCELEWYQLAAIGKVESGHGTFRGARVGSDGVTSQRILGPALDGERFASISDTDGGALDGDTVWDRAVGPMQFIPSSWRIFGQDGNGDDQRDPHNLYDAAAAAADHLCRRHVGLSAPGNYQQSLLGYNRSEPYGRLVMSYADQYRAALTIDPTPLTVSASPAALAAQLEGS